MRPSPFFATDLEVLQPLKRRVYLLLLPLGAAAAVFGWWLIDFGRSETTFFEAYALPVFAGGAALGWLGMLLIPRWLRWLELAVFLLTLWILTGNLYYNFLGFRNGDGLWQPTLWMGIMFPACHFVFETRWARRVSVGVLLGYLLAGVLALLRLWAEGSGDKIDPNTVVQLYAAQIGYFLITGLLVGVGEHIARLRQGAAELFQQANTDPLTGAANRRLVMETLRSELARAQQTGAPLSLILLDLDRFKAVNDAFGHEAGDRVLTFTAQLLQQHRRKADLLGRWGGEEFVLLLPDTPAEEARSTAQRLQAVLAENSLQNLPPVSASFGVATANPADTPDTLVSRADRAMYGSKQAGGNRVSVSTKG